MNNRLTVKFKRGGRVQRSHGGYSYLVKGKLPENRKRILKYLTAAREALVKDLGEREEDLSASQIIIIDRIISKLGIIRCIEEHVRENSVMTGKNTLAPCLRASYLAYNNSVRLDLLALPQLASENQERSLTPLELARQIDQERQEEERNKK